MNAKGVALFLVLLLASVQCQVEEDEFVNSGDDNSDYEIESINNKEVVNGKTYFIQMKKTGNDENPIYTKINHYKKEFEDRKAELKRFYDSKDSAPANLRMMTKSYNIQKTLYEDEEDETTPAQLIDDDWNFNPQHMNFDLPNITHEVYEAMVESTRLGVKSSIVKFFFEIDADENSNVIKFDISSLENLTERIMDAELHVYRLPRDENSTKVNTTENIVRLYQMKEGVESGTETSSLHPDVHKLANVIYISSRYSGWQVFKVKNVVENWRNGEENLGFMISTSDSKDNIDYVNFVHRQHFGGKYQPSLVVYLDRFDTETEDNQTQPLKKPSYKHHSTYGTNYNLLTTPCARNVWYISFHELGWNNFIISPSGYMAYRCKGHCKSPEHLNFTNHAKLLNIYEKQGIESPCCVPTGYKNMLIMYYDREGNVVIKEYPDMVVSSCGCR